MRRCLMSSEQCSTGCERDTRKNELLRKIKTMSRLVHHAHIGASLKEELHDGKMVIHGRIVECCATVLRDGKRQGRSASCKNI